MENSKLEVRANVKFLTKLGWEKKEIIKAVDKVYGDDAPSSRTIYRWIAQFADGREAIEDDDRSGRPSTSTNDKKVDEVRELLEEDRRISVKVIAKTLNISVGSVETILKDRLGLSKLSARWVPKMLRVEQKAQRADCALQFLQRFDDNPNDFLDRIVTGDETWIYQFDPENKNQSKQWLEKGSKGPIKFKSERSVGKVMATIFWDAQGVILIDFLQGQQTITGAYYEGVLRKLHNELLKKRHGKITQRILFHHDNAPAHSSKLSRSVLRDFRWELIPHPPYSPDLAPSDFFLFPKLKEHLKGNRWESISEAKQAVIHWFASQDDTFYREGLERWRHRMLKCFNSDGDYVEK